MIHGVDTSFLVALEVASHNEHAACRLQIRRLLDAGDAFALAPQVLTEFIHAVTDPKRFTAPLTVEQAVHRAEFWWNAGEVTHVFPTSECMLLFLNWMTEHQLGRKRVLDTMFAATLQAANVVSLLTLDRKDFAIFEGFAFPK
jgi:predicted nucleic acid-binding protein